MILETPRLRLQPLTPEDFLSLLESAESFHERFGTPAAEGLRDFICSDDVPASFIELLRESSGIDPWLWGFAVVEKTSGQVVGNAGFKGPPDEDGMVEIGYGIVPGFEGRGLATETVAELLGFAFDHPVVVFVRAHTMPDMNASCRVLQKNGFVDQGLVEDPDDGVIRRWECSASGGT